MHCNRPQRHVSPSESATFHSYPGLQAQRPLVTNSWSADGPRSEPQHQSSTDQSALTLYSYLLLQCAKSQHIIVTTEFLTVTFYWLVKLINPLKPSVIIRCWVEKIVRQSSRSSGQRQKTPDDRTCCDDVAEWWDSKPTYRHNTYLRADMK